MTEVALCRRQCEITIRRTFPGYRRDRLWVKIGNFLYTGMWYGRDATDPKSYGKCVDAKGFRIVGHVGRNAPALTTRKLR